MDSLPLTRQWQADRQNANTDCLGFESKNKKRSGLEPAVLIVGLACRVKNWRWSTSGSWLPCRGLALDSRGRPWLSKIVHDADNTLVERGSSTHFSENPKLDELPA